MPAQTGNMFNNQHFVAPVLSTRSLALGGNAPLFMSYQLGQSQGGSRVRNTSEEDSNLQN